MCCHACTGYPECESRQRLTDDCCIRCKYYDTCMEEELEATENRTKSRSGTVAKRRYVKR